MAMIKWIVTTSAIYHALEAERKDSNALYFLEDTKEIYKGAESFTQATELVTGNFPAKGAKGRIYIDSSNLEGKIWNGTQWQTVIEPVATELNDEREETKAVSGDAVKAYVREKLTAEMAKKVDDISYDKIKKQLTYTKGSESTTLNIDGFLTGANYNPKSGMLSFDVQGGRGIHINLPKDNFVQAGSYDAERKLIVLELVSGDTVEIPAEDLIDKTEFVDTRTVNMSVSEEGKVTADVRVDERENNQIQVTDNGLYVAPTDLSDKLDKVEENHENEIIIANTNGSVKTSGKKVGGETISNSPNANTLATEAAVSAIRATLVDQISTKISKSDITQEIHTESLASENKVVSEKAVAGAIDALKSEKINRTDISKKIDQATASQEKVVSEAAVVAALSWVVLE